MKKTTNETAIPFSHPPIPSAPGIVDPILRLKDVERVVGLKRSRIYALMGTGEFPQAVHLSARAIGWRASDIQAWINTRRLVSEARWIKSKAARYLRGEEDGEA
ncbi:MAG: helix-turn-helix transcriptional regulator [Pseudomonadota bacterium]|jgi:prophage regulatory protein